MSVKELVNESFELSKQEKHDEAIEKLEQALDAINDKSEQIYELHTIYFLLGHCYWQQAEKATNTSEGHELLNQAAEHFQQQLEFAKQLADELSIQAQNNAQFWLGRCYFEQAQKTRDMPKMYKLFNQAIGHFQQQLELAKQLANELSIQEQNFVQYWLGLCYFEQAQKTRDMPEMHKLFNQAIGHFQQQLELAEQLADEQTIIQEQNFALNWLGSCYLLQTRTTDSLSDADNLFKQAAGHFKEQIQLSEQLTDKKISIKEQSSAQYCLFCCYLIQARKINDSPNNESYEHIKAYRNRQKEDLLNHAEKLYHQIKNNIAALNDDEQKQFRDINYLLNTIYFLRVQPEEYYTAKIKNIPESLFQNECNEYIKNAVKTILAVLNIAPIELDDTPIAHYTTPDVCEKLLIPSKDDTPVMRMNSSTYMNDPTEGKSLLDLLGLPELELENKTDCTEHKAFFTCFSSRINDLNQFRLYGKEHGVEASGCCLVFNKNGGWLQDPDFSAAYRNFIGKDKISGETLAEADTEDSSYENLPLYQIAYIAYKDDYIAEYKCSFWLTAADGSKFGIRLKDISDNAAWNEYRKNKLKDAVTDLIQACKNTKIGKNEKQALECIRYLFKDFAFRDEEEFRLLKMENINSETIEAKKVQYCEATDSVYLEYADVRDMVDEVILGTNYEKTYNKRKVEAFQYRLKQECPDIIVSRSSLPINANPPIKPD